MRLHGELRIVSPDEVFVEADVNANRCQRGIIKRPEGIEIFGIHFGGTVAAQQFVLKKDAHFGHHRLAVVAPCGGNLYGRNQIFLTVGAQHANRQLGTGKNHRFGQVFQHET